jgi:hypothetical protein
MTRRTTQKRAPLTRDRVLRAALELADEGGTATLTMQRIGRRLGVEAIYLPASRRSGCASLTHRRSMLASSRPSS